MTPCRPASGIQTLKEIYIVYLASKLLYIGSAFLNEIGSSNLALFLLSSRKERKKENLY